MIKIFIPFLTLLFAACNSNNQKDSSSSTSELKDSVATNSTTPEGGGTAILKDDKLNAVYQHYAHLTDALIDGNVKEARLASNAIETGAGEIPEAKTLGVAAAKITAATDIEKQRAAFSGLSDDFITLVKKSGIKGGQLYVDFCPMALNDKGAFWLSSEKAIRNPYFGDKMMTCGDVKETIK